MTTATYNCKMAALKCELLAKRLERLKTQMLIKQMQQEILSKNAGKVQS